MTQREPRARLQEKIGHLSDPQVDVVERVVDAVLTDVTSEILPKSWLVNPRWEEAFLTRLRAHHALNPEPLSTLLFEAAFNSACTTAGWSVTPADSATNRFFDTRIQMKKTSHCLSLKTTSAKNLSPTKLHISKLTEAAWIQDVRTQKARRDKIVELMDDYQAQTSALMMLRCFRDEVEDLLKYELIEIPTSILSSAKTLTSAQAQHSTIPLPPGPGPYVVKIRIDRSDAKITLTGIPIGSCKVHGRWEIPNLSGVTSDGGDG